MKSSNLRLNRVEPRGALHVERTANGPEGKINVSC
jgi:hypothetical protein